MLDGGEVYGVADVADEETMVLKDSAEQAPFADVDVASLRLARVNEDTGVVEGEEAKVLRRCEASGEGVREVRGGSSRSRER